jgi:membrane-associated protease RseP (regulator of RpoE activity)
MMSTPEVGPRSSRETRLLLVTIAISVGVLLLLARFRFPDDPSAQSVESAPAPLERLAARAAYEELASIMADLDRRITPRVTIVRARSADGSTSVAVAPRVLPDRVVAIVPFGSSVIGGNDLELINQEAQSRVTVFRVPAIDDSAVPIRQLPLRTGPRYVGVVEATAGGPVLTPVYVGRIESIDDALNGTPLLSFAGLQRPVAPGAAIFTLEGLFIGLVKESGDTLTVVPAETLRTSAQSAQPSATSPAPTLGIEVDVLTAPLSRATGADHGVVVVHVAKEVEGGLRTGDVIQSIDGTTVTTPAQFHEIERSRAPGATVTIDAMRARVPLKVSIQAIAGSVPQNPSEDPGFVGRSIADVGIEIVAVAEGTAASRAGLRRGDLITAIDGIDARNAADLSRRFRSAKPSTTFLLTIAREDGHHVLPLEKR